MTNNQLAENSVIQLLNSVKLALDNAERADNRVDHSFYYALTIALEELQERRKADSEPVAEVVSIYGDPEAFGEREIRPLVGIQQMPYGTKLYRHAQPAPEYPEVLPCSVLLEPGLRFGKGIKTSTMLAALARRAVHESDMAALSPEERVEFQARIEDFKALIAQPAPVVPDKMTAIVKDEAEYVEGWNACRAAMLAAAPQSPSSELATVPGKWIPVSERMPEDRISVILWDAEIGEVTSGHYSHKTQTFYHCGDAIENEITHWMPPPCAPQDVK
ncbi:DUF551 domain-containing protein [Klebsiella pneumoniae]|uniref:DUF551 domain-containing protein n=1 Tax=Klebsiella pneumoniae TaxID=573 RepID=UPI003A4D8962|nr:DUF551 domain-containing protein [Klebsiella pneumoniae]